MIRAFTVTNELGDYLRCELENPYANGVNVRNITGIGPEAVTIATNELAIIDGSVFSSQRAPERNITFELSFLDMPDGEPVRHLTYKMFSIGSLVRLTFETDERMLYIDGYVESNSPSIFEEEEYTQISIICPDPWFRSTAVDVGYKISSDIKSSTTGFEFDKSYPQHTIEFDEDISDQLVPAGWWYGFSGYIVENPGDRPVGLTLRITATKDIEFSTFYLYNRTLGTTTIVMLPQNVKLSKGDIIVYSTTPGYRMLYHLKQSLVKPNDFVFDSYYDGLYDQYRVTGYVSEPNLVEALRGPYHKEFWLQQPTTNTGWSTEVTQERALQDSPGWIDPMDPGAASFSPPIAYRYDGYRLYTEKAPIASEDIYQIENSAIPNPPLQPLKWLDNAVYTFQSSVSTYDYLQRDPWSRPDVSAETNPQSYLSSAFGSIGLMEGLSESATSFSTTTWMKLARGINVLELNIGYFYMQPPAGDYPSHYVRYLKDGFELEYETVPLYEGV